MSEAFLPLPNEFTQPFWDAAKRHVLVAQKCKFCAARVWYPREFCPECTSSELEWTELSGRGEVYAFTVMRQPASSDAAAEPYILAIVQTAEGTRMYTNVVCPFDDIYIGMPVRTHFDDVNDEVTLVKWEPE